jgi:hypothetical protein
VAVAYVVGHLLAGLASAILERRFVGKYLGRPSVLLLGTARGPRWFRSLYPEFYEALPQATIDKILSKARIQGISESGEALFWLAYDHARKRKARASRVGTFLNLYGLCHNLSMTAIIVSLMLVVSGWHRENSQDYWRAVANAILGDGMFLRYLKFYRTTH